MDSRLIGATAVSAAVALYSDNQAIKTMAAAIAAALALRALEPWFEAKGTT